MTLAGGGHGTCLRSIARRPHPEESNRLAPECPYPAAVDDCAACIDWLATHDEELGIDMGKLVVIGDSAEGSLANAMVMRGERTHPVALVVTMYAVIDS